MGLALVREVPCDSYSWGEKFLPVALFLEEKFSVTHALNKDVPSGSYSEESSSQPLLLLKEKFLVALALVEKFPLCNSYS
jgi:hypothetical protein